MYLGIDMSGGEGGVQSGISLADYSFGLSRS